MVALGNIAPVSSTSDDGSVMVMDTSKSLRLISGTRKVKERGLDGSGAGRRHQQNPWMLVTPTELVEVGQGFEVRGGSPKGSLEQ